MREGLWDQLTLRCSEKPGWPLLSSASSRCLFRLASIMTSVYCWVANMLAAEPVRRRGEMKWQSCGRGRGSERAGDVCGRGGMPQSWVRAWRNEKPRCHGFVKKRSATRQVVFVSRYGADLLLRSRVVCDGLGVSWEAEQSRSRKKKGKKKSTKEMMMYDGSGRIGFVVTKDESLKQQPTGVGGAGGGRRRETGEQAMVGKGPPMGGG